MGASWHPMEFMEMKFLTESELREILQRHFRRHIDRAELLATPGVGPILQVAFADPDNEKNNYGARQVSG